MGAKASYGSAAHDLGVELVHHHIRLVYGGGSVGLMGLIADSVLKHGGEVIGILPQTLAKRDVEHHHLSEMHIVDTMHDRKAMMAELSDAFVTMPGGFGTYEELFEVISWAQLGIHRKPILLLNIDGYFDLLIQMIAHSVAEGYIRQVDADLVRVTTNVAEVIPILQESPRQEHRSKYMDIDKT
jgi:uncharacterized protein (TIGR00730 family)